jgi:hypothetical protein
MAIVLSPKSLVHVVLISFRKGASPDDRQWASSTLQRLGKACGGESAGILFWQVSDNLDQRKNWHLVEFAIFRENEALQQFRMHPAHVEVSERLRAFADWAIGDFETASSVDGGLLG